jgi:hypothetical protein
MKASTTVLTRRIWPQSILVAFMVMEDEENWVGESQVPFSGKDGAG